MPSFDVAALLVRIPLGFDARQLPRTRCVPLPTKPGLARVSRIKCAGEGLGVGVVVILLGMSASTQSVFDV